MPATTNLQTTLSWCLPYLNYQPLTIDGVEPAVSNANLIVQTMVGPPLRWAWNRSTASATIGANAQDIAFALPDFGYLEKATITDGAGNVRELSLDPVLSLNSSQQRPIYIAVQLDDQLGNITFRLSPLADQPYTLTLIYQRQARPMTSLASVWPIPDQLAYVFNWGFLSLATLIDNDARAAQYTQRFMAHLLGNQEGLTETQRNLFLANWLGINAQVQRTQARTQQGVTAGTI